VQDKVSQAFHRWLDASFDRWLRELTHAEIARSLSQLSVDYVNRRHRLQSKDALAGRGKRAAFALYYAPRHFLLVHRALASLPAIAVPCLVDLGCGTGVAAAAWCAMLPAGVTAIGVDTSPWVLAETRATWSAFGVRGRTVRSPLARYRWPRPPCAIVAAFTVNELEAADRDPLLVELQRQKRAGSTIALIEPLATRVTPWWTEWSRAFLASGGRDVEVRFTGEDAIAALPKRVSELGRAAGLDPSELGARALIS